MQIGVVVSITKSSLQPSISANIADNRVNRVFTLFDVFMVDELRETIETIYDVT